MAATQHPTRAGGEASAAPRWELYRLLADPTRLKLLALCSLEELAVSKLAELVGESQPKVSRQATALREARLLNSRKQGTWVLLRKAPQIELDAVVADALKAGMQLCRNDGTSDRVKHIIAARDVDTRAFFARGGRSLRSGPPAEVAAYLKALAALIPRKTLAVDAGTGDGALLEVLAPVFDQVIAVDRSQAQLDLAKQRCLSRQFHNVTFLCSEIDGIELTSHSSAGDSGADVVFASRVLHHAPVPAKAMQALAQLVRRPCAADPGGSLFIIDYLAHKNEQLREKQADLWLGFEAHELEQFAADAQLVAVGQGTLPPAWCGDGPDQHLVWQWLAARHHCPNS